MHTKTAFVVLAALASAAAVGCGSSSSSNGGPIGTTRASLHRAKTCPDLLSDLKADAAYKLNKGISRQIETIQACLQKYGDDQCAYYGGYYGGGGGMAIDEAAARDASGAPPPMAGPVASNNASSSSSSGSSGAGDSSAKSEGAPTEAAQSYSETNTQVQGVDEADIVKNDGQNLYILHGRAFKVVKAWPATELKETATIDVEGQPSEMFVADGKVVVYSQVNGTAIFSAAGVAPKQAYTEYGYASGGFGGDAKMIAPSDPGGAPQAYTPLTKVTVMAFDGAAVAVTREVYFEGSYLDSRRVGPHVRSVFQGYQYGPKLKHSVYELYPPRYVQAPVDPNAPEKASTVPNPDYPAQDPYPKTGSQMIAALEQLRAANLAAINASQLGEWLPYTFEKNGAAVSAKTVACEDFYVPTAGSTESGLTEVASIDLSNPAAPTKETAILGRADTVYGNGDTLYLAAHAWIEPPFVWNDPFVGVGSSGGSAESGTGVASPPVASDPGTPTPEPAPAPTPGGKSANLGKNLAIGVRPQTDTAQSSAAGIITWSSNNTHIHKFEFASQPDFPNYVASGTIQGSVKDQFSLDDKDGFLRVATTENRQYVTTDGKYVATEAAPPGSTAPPVRPGTVSHVYVLEQKGPWLEKTGDVGDLAPNEQIRAVRFVDHRGYVVTFRQVDPLFVIELAQPSKPQVLAALKIPGFSEYMHPIDANHLLTIGRDASETGRQQGLQLQVFDVTNGANPILQHKFTYTGEEYGSSEAEYDHKAFTYFADKNLLAFPYYSSGGVNGMRSSLELFKVDLATGFAKLGSIDHTTLVKNNPTGYCGGYFGPQVRRGVFLENFVYSISYGGIVVRDANDLAAGGAQLALPSPQLNQGYGYDYAPCY
jgi:hypothetical protein